jgi:hypothetical protein
MWSVLRHTAERFAHWTKIRRRAERAEIGARHALILDWSTCSSQRRRREEQFAEDFGSGRWKNRARKRGRWCANKMKQRLGGDLRPRNTEGNRAWPQAYRQLRANSSRIRTTPRTFRTLGSAGRITQFSAPPLPITPVRPEHDRKMRRARR